MKEINWSPKLSNWIIRHSVLSDVNYIEQLKGATSSKLFLITDNNKKKAVIRFYTNHDWNNREPDLAKHEAFSLQTAEESCINTPSLFAYTYNNDITQYPAVLMSYLPGEIILPKNDKSQWLKELANLLADFHRTASHKPFPWSYYPYNKIDSITIPSWSRHTNEFKETLELVKSYTPHFNSGFIHRDFHPVNVMWENGKATGIVDWPNACYGPKEVDIGHCRLNLALLYGVDEAALFLNYYKESSQIEIPDQSYWDFITLLDSLPDPGVYEPWVDFGIGGLTDDLIKERWDTYFTTIHKEILRS
ncbi:aminoglycoside phosphotransferase family protein [Bacillus sp. NEB1478]|uniref:aminoglycoside phosphotransferase family protein n=1 Tax=Bacillus sp. NEB1478 TaxID=3073816 RepID=UPI0028732323|nr:aminoglycoside phosphotransferase family protein [Bacillus sp. NEB1478]WNB90190.1 aminoglycoside phosphotransferase family protein [Bacillus sp. NEB1478]